MKGLRIRFLLCQVDEYRIFILINISSMNYSYFDTRPRLHPDYWWPTILFTITPLYKLFKHSCLQVNFLSEISSIEDVEIRELLYTIDGDINYYRHYEKMVWRFLKKLKILWSSNLTSGNVSKEIEIDLSKGFLCSYFHRSWFTITKGWNQPKYPQ